MKKFMALAIAFALSLSFVGCGDSSANESAGSTDQINNEASEQEHSDNDEKLKISIAQFAEHGSLDNCREGFIDGLKEEGFEEGKNIEIEYQNAQADMGAANQIAQNFVNDKADLICAIATPMAQACYNAADGTDIPVIYTAVTDPVAAELSNENKLSEKNATGTSDKLPVEQQLKMIRAFMPEAKKIGILYSTSEVNSETAIEQYKEKAGEYGFEIVESGVNQSADIPMAAADIASKVDCITNLTDNTIVSNLAVVLDAAEKASIPVFGSEIEQVKNGCVAAAGLDYIELGKLTGKMAASVLKNEKKANEIEYEVISQSNVYINSQALDKFNLSVPDDMKESVIEAE